MRLVRCGEGAGESCIPLEFYSYVSFSIHWCLMAKAQRFCIFCGGPGLSREHVWSEWTYQFVPKLPNGTHVKFTADSVPHNPRIVESYRSKSYQGDVNTIKLNVVCKTRCNNGWMSKLDERVKPTLIPLLRAEPTVLTRDRQTVLAAWMAMKAMVCEHYEQVYVTSTQEHRNHVMENQRAPDFWSIWIGHQRGNAWRTAFSRRTAALGPIIDGKPTPPNGSYAKNTQSTTMGIGNLLIHLIACSIPNFRFEMPNDTGRYLRRIWPIQGDLLWPPGSILSDGDCERIEHSMARYLESIPWASSNDSG
jgi:hypothetical protein